MNYSLLHHYQKRLGAPIVHSVSSCYRLLRSHGTWLALSPLAFIGVARAEDPTGAGAAVLTQVRSLFSEGVNIGLLLLAAVGFLLVAWATLSKFNEARRGRADWGEVAVPFVFGAALLVFIGYLVTEGQTAATAIGGA